MWYWIFHSFTAAVCLAVLVIAAPFHPLAPLALQCLQEALELFQRADGERAKNAAERIGRLTERASRSMARWSENKTQAAANLQGKVSHNPNNASEIARFPTSNLRSDPEDLLGASTKLIRLEPQWDFASLSSPLPLESNMQFASPSIGEGLNVTSASATPDQGYLPSYVGPNTSTDVDNSPLFDWRPMSDLPPSVDGVDPLQLDLTLFDGVDLSSFIQNGADAWMLDTTVDLGMQVSSVNCFFYLALLVDDRTVHRKKKLRLVRGSTSICHGSNNNVVRLVVYIVRDAC